MIALSYVSCSTHRFSQDELTTLLKTCHSNNAKLGVSGLLLYNNAGTFIQVLEGDEAIVDKLYCKISDDPRHTRVNCILRKSIKTRDFPDWKMGFRYLSDSSAHVTRTIPGFSDFMCAEAPDQYLLDNKGISHQILTHFKNETNQVVM